MKIVSVCIKCEQSEVIADYPEDMCPDTVERDICPDCADLYFGNTN